MSDLYYGKIVFIRIDFKGLTYIVYQFMKIWEKNRGSW
jgi:hypothetical protein